MDQLHILHNHRHTEGCKFYYGPQKHYLSNSMQTCYVVREDGHIYHTSPVEWKFCGRQVIKFIAKIL